MSGGNGRRRRGPPAPILAPLEAQAKLLGDVVGASLPKGVGFALQLFTFDESGFLTYVSNARREDMVQVLREMADKIESAEKGRQS